MSLQFGKLPGSPANVAAPAFAAVQLTRPTGAGNPFMAAMDSAAPQFMATYGVNRPLSKPMFVGYHGDKAVIGGSRLFVLC
ncbi:MAG: hypothetical protein IPK79_06765 [Vampirovibrionales bacterium]|nr:hypothetical protein [Vampirovibrionales bacterium]